MSIKKIFHISIVVCLMISILGMSIGCVEQPKYVTVMTIELDNLGDWEDSIVVQDVYDCEKVYTGNDFYGYKTYNIKVYYYIGSSKYTRTYTGINSIDILQVYEKKIS